MNWRPFVPLFGFLLAGVVIVWLVKYTPKQSKWAPIDPGCQDVMAAPLVPCPKGSYLFVPDGYFSSGTPLCRCERGWVDK